MQPLRRDLDFTLPAERIHDWHPRGEHVTQFFNTLSVFFPLGERFFIHTVRNYRDQVTDPELKQAVIGFIGQEAMHSREHEDYNEMAAAAGLPVRAIESKVDRLLTHLRGRPHALQLSVTVALEHYTAILADILLRDPAIVDGADPTFKEMWTWHALEETEHKAVAYDVYETVVGTGPFAYLLRSTTMLATSVLFWGFVGYAYLRVLVARKRLFDVRGWWQVTKFLWGRPGALRRNLLPWVDYFRPRFHPWDHDNREFLSRIEPLAERHQARAS